MGRARRAFGVPGGGRKKTKHAPKGTKQGGQFIGPASVTTALVQALGAAAAGQPTPAKKTARPRMAPPIARKTSAPAKRAASPAKPTAAKKASAPASPSGATPSGATKITARVAGTTGVTSTLITPQQGLFQTAKQSLEIQLNGVTIGTIHHYSYGWVGEDANGNLLSLGTPKTKTGVVQGLVARHKTSTGAASTTVAGATLQRGSQVFGNSPDRYEVLYHGQPVGDIHGDESDPSGTWTAFVPPGAGYTQAGGNPGQQYATKDDATQGLVDAHNQHLLGQALGMPASPPQPAAPRPIAPKVTTRRSVGGYDVQANGVDIGHVHQQRGVAVRGQRGQVGGGWIANPPAGGGLTGTLNAGPHNTRQDAIDALVAVMPQRAQSAAKTSLTKLPQTYARQVGATEAHQVRLGATPIGEVRRVPAGWRAYDSNGQQLGSTTSSRPSAVARVLGAQLGTYPPTSSPTSTPTPAAVPWAPLPGTPAAPAAGAPTVQLRRFSAGGGYDVTANGVNVGTVEHVTSSYWKAFPDAATGVSAPLSGRYRSRTDAVDALVAATAHHHSPTPTPPAAPAAPLPSTSDPAIKAAHDVIYGVDPKAKTAARQLTVYGALRQAQFDILDPAEQQTLLADLQYIAGTSKGPNAAKAQALISRFTPAGTPSGTIPPQAIIPPAGAASAQTRVADPAGTPGLIKMKAKGQRGRSGDGWTRTASGGSGPWGQYGAAGLMLRHVDPGTGEERFLMVQRGPGISDPGKWQFPGGAKEEREDFYEGAAREVIEELGFDASDLDTARVHGTHTNEVPTVTVPGLHGGQVPWAYVSIAATVDRQLTPDLSTPHARAETSDAKWMTRAEIDALDQQGKLLRPLAGGKLQQNVLTLFPPAATPGRMTSGLGPTARKMLRRPPRLKGAPTPKTPHKPSKGKDLIPDQAAQDQLRAHIATVRKSYRGKTADERLASIGAMQGYDDTPTVVSKAEMDRLLATGDYIEAWRGMTGSWSGRGKTAAQIHEEMRSGPAYYGTGVFGNGYYLSTQKSVARGYADGTKNSLMRVLIPKSAKTEVHSKVKRKADATSSSARSSAYVGMRSGDLGGGTLRDEGRYAAAAGLDGIEIPHNSGGFSMSATHIAGPGQPAYVWVNRSVLIIQEADP